MYLLDTNVFSAARRADRAPRIMAWLAEKPEAELFISAISVGEIERGIFLQTPRNPGFAHDLRIWLDDTVRIFADRILPFSLEEAQVWGQLSARLGNNGPDLMIAATALVHGATVVTGNSADFVATGARLENPF